MQFVKEPILYVDDEQGNLTGFKFSFRRYYTIFLASSADEAMQIVKKNKIKVVISDQRMPEKTGTELFEELIEIFPDIVRIILTGFSDMTAIVQAINKGKVYRYISKPWDKDEMKISIDNAIESYNLKEQNQQLISHLKETNQKLLHAKRRAEESDKLKSSFLANVSHEIRTPLNSIVGFSNLITSTEFSEPQRKEFSDIIQRNAEELITIINDIIDISKIEANLLYFRFGKFSVAQLLNELFASFKNHNLFTEKTNLEIELLQPEQEVFIATDRHRVKQILSNLLHNALKYTEKGKIELGFTLKRKPNNTQTIEFFVRDTGIGIPKDKFEYIFQRFRKIQHGKDQLFRGNGLGLSISRSLAQLLGGNMRVESQIGKGSTFYLTLPTEKLPPTPKDDFNQKDRKIFNQFNWSDKIILIVEDDFSNFQYLQTALAPTGAHILHASDGKEAIDFCKKFKEIDLVLMDILLPKLDGYQATQQIKKIRPELPIIAQTAYAMTHDRKKSLEAGCDEYIAKPITRNEILEKINLFLQ